MITASQNFTYTLLPSEQQKIEHVFQIPENESAQISVVFDVHDHAQLTYHPIIIGGTLELTITLNLIGEYARGNVQGAYVLRGKQRATIITKQNHNAPHTHSALEINGILNDSARAQYSGMIIIAKHAHGSDADQQNKTILLSPKAHARSIPSLEVLNNDVQCAHGSAISYLDEQQLLYLRSRGIDQLQAQHMLLAGFLSDALSAINDETRQLCMSMI